MDTIAQKARTLDDPLVTGILDVLGRLAGSHPGFRPVHPRSRRSHADARTACVPRRDARDRAFLGRGGAADDP
jgi:hypothetical protein